MKRTPAYLFRAMDVTVNGDDKIGQVAEFQIPDIKKKMEKVWNAGMIKERMVALGLEVGDAEFKMTAYDPATLNLFGVGFNDGGDVELLLSKALADEDGIWHSATVTVKGQMHEIKAEKHEMGKKHSTDYKFSVNYCHVIIDGADVIEFDDFTLKVGGVDMLAQQNRALGRA